MRDLTEAQAVFVFATCPDCFWFNPSRVPRSSGLKTSQTVQFARLFLLGICDFHNHQQKIATAGLAFTQFRRILGENKESSNLTLEEKVSRAMDSFLFTATPNESSDNDDTQADKHNSDDDDDNSL